MLTGEELYQPKPTCKVWKESPITHMDRCSCKASSIKKNQVNITLPEETNTAPVIDPTEMEIYEQSDRIQNNLLKEVY